MKVLLDTHLLLWAAGQPELLSQEARDLLDDPANELLFSTANLWEVIIKRAFCRDDFLVNPRLLRRGLLDNGYGELRSPASTPSLSSCCRQFTRIPSTAS